MLRKLVPQKNAKIDMVLAYHKRLTVLKWADTYFWPRNKKLKKKRIIKSEHCCVSFFFAVDVLHYPDVCFCNHILFFFSKTLTTCTPREREIHMTLFFVDLF